MRASDALLAGLHGAGSGLPDGTLADDDLPPVEVHADGWLGDLLSGQADRRLEPVSTPTGLHRRIAPLPGARGGLDVLPRLASASALS